MVRVISTAFLASEGISIANDDGASTFWDGGSETVADYEMPEPRYKKVPTTTPAAIQSGRKATRRPSAPKS